jgi:hypothetical protein
VGTAVAARYSGGSVYSAGAVTKANADGTYLIGFFAGGRPRGPVERHLLFQIPLTPMRVEWYIKLFLSVHFAANWVSVH